MNQKRAKQKILKKVENYYNRYMDDSDHKFIASKTRINYAGRVFDSEELVNLVDASLEFWLTHGDYSEHFEQQLGKYLNIEYVLLVNSGSSANLLAFSALTSPLLKDRRIKRKDEVITVAACFPTTVAPIIQYGAVPVFVDIDLETLNIDINMLEKALTKKTKAIFIAHTLGNPFNITVVKEFCKTHNLWLIEDNADSLGSKYAGQYTGTFGDIGTSSFYPAHFMTMGEAGAVYTHDPQLNKIMQSMRGWGRDCICKSGVDNTCGKRFFGKYGTLPLGYDHKYVYSNFGYNLKATEMQAAIGCAQLMKLHKFAQKRERNFNLIYSGLKEYTNYFILPTATDNSEPVWFGFPIIVQDNVNISRNSITEHLENNNIQTRNLFAGNITRHPCFDTLRQGIDYRRIGKLKNTDKVMHDCFWIGVYPKIGHKEIDYIVNSIKKFISQNS